MPTPKPDVDRAAMGARIQAALDGAGLEQAELNRQMGLGTNTVWRWCKGRSVPTGPHMAALVGMLGGSMEFYLYGIGPAPSASSPGFDPPYPSWSTFLAMDEAQGAPARAIDNLHQASGELGCWSCCLDIMRDHDGAPVGFVAEGMPVTGPIPQGALNR